LEASQGPEARGKVGTPQASGPFAPKIVREPEVRGIESYLGRRVVLAEAFDGSEDIVCRLGPSERPWIGIVVAEKEAMSGRKALTLR
jgi:hypothetical protein